MELQKINTYQIAGRVFTQKPIVLGQMRQLLSELKGTVIPADLNIQQAAQSLDLLALFGEKLPALLAIVLVEEGKNLRDKNVQALAKDLEYDISPELAMEIIGDFFDCNGSLLASMNKKIEDITAKVGKTA